MKPLLILKTYVWIINTIRSHGPITLREIQELWAADRLSENNSMVRQTFNHYKNDLEEFFGISIGCDKHYRYYIEHEGLLTRNTVQRWLLSSLSMDTELAYNRDVYERISMESIPSAEHFLREIVDAMKANRTVRMEYWRYDKSQPRSHEVEPYFLKLYHQRWYLIGRKPGLGF